MTQRAGDGDIVVAVALAFKREAAAKSMKSVVGDAGYFIQAAQHGTGAMIGQSFAVAADPKGIALRYVF